MPPENENSNTGFFFINKYKKKEWIITSISIFDKIYFNVIYTPT